MFGINRIFVIISFLSVQFTFAKHKTNDSNEPQLIFANVIFRHGDRNVRHPFKNDPWKSLSNWPGGLGQLTHEGKQQQFELGKYLRKRYQTLLDKEKGKNINDIIYVRSTNVDRTLMSAAANLAGMFPPVGKEMWNSELRWKPIPIHTMSKRLDYTLAWSRPCSRYDAEYLKYKERSGHQSYYRKFHSLIRYLRKHSGDHVSCFQDVYEIYDTLKIEQRRNLTLPKWADRLLIPGGEMEEIALIITIKGSETPEMARLSVGFLLREMLERFKEKIESKLSPDRSIWMYSAHDTTISMFLNSLGVLEPHLPTFCATIFLELYKLNDQFYIQLSYKNSSADPMQIDIPSCGPMCSIEKFYEIYKAIIPTGDFEEECRLDSEVPYSEFTAFDSDMFVIGISLCFYACILFGIVVSWRFVVRTKYNCIESMCNYLTVYK